MSCPESDLSKVTLLVSARLGSNLHLADLRTCIKHHAVLPLITENNLGNEDEI